MTPPAAARKRKQQPVFAAWILDTQAVRDAYVYARRTGTACGNYHVPSTACPAYMPVAPAPAWQTPPASIFPNRDAEILAVLERIEALLLQLIPHDGA